MAASRRLLLALLLPSGLAARQAPAYRFAPAPGVQILLVADSSTGLVVWAAGVRRPERKPAPDFVGWFDPDSVRAWLPLARSLLALPSPDTSAVETRELVAADGGFLTLVHAPDQGGRPWLLSFGHLSQRERWFLAGRAAEWAGLLDSLASLSRRSRLRPPAGTGYANPTHLVVTPDRLPESPLPPGAPGPGEVWASAELDPAGAVVQGTVRILWSDAPSLAEQVRALLPRYRYQRHDGGRPSRLRIYQRFRVR